MRINVFVRFKNETHDFCHWPVMQDQKSKRYYFGTLSETYPTGYNKRTVGGAIAWVLKQNIAHVQVKLEPDYDQRDDQGSGSSSGCEASYLMCH